MTRDLSHYPKADIHGEPDYDNWPQDRQAEIERMRKEDRLGVVLEAIEREERTTNVSD